MINIVIPMAGEGSRFAKFGYTVPKPLIEIRERPFFYYSTMSLVNFFAYANLIFIGLKSHNIDNLLETKIKQYFPNAKIKLLDETPPGAVLTARNAIDMIDNNYPVIFNDCDHMFYSEHMRLSQDDFSSYDGLLMTFFANTPIFSYVKKDDKGNVIGTVEKQVVSDEAIGGIYGFKNIELFDKASKKYIEKCSYNEFFMSGVYNMEQIKSIKTYKADFNISFGTVEEFEAVRYSRLFDFLSK